MSPTESPSRVAAPPVPERRVANLWRVSLKCRCPRCGEGPLLQGVLKMRDACPACGLDYGFADPADGPAFFVMSLMGVVGMAGMMAFELSVQPPLWMHLVVTLPLISALCILSLRPFKAWLVAEQYARNAAEPDFSASMSDKDAPRE